MENLLKPPLLILLIILFTSFLFLSGCADNPVTFSEIDDTPIIPPDEPDTPDMPDVPIVYQGVFYIGSGILTMVEDENGKIDIISSYLYTKNPNEDSYGRIYLSYSNVNIVEDELYYTQTIRDNQLNTYCLNILDDNNGSSLDNEDHLLLVRILFDDNGNLIVKFKLMNEKGEIVVNRTIK